MPKGRVSAEELEDRLAETGRALVRLRSYTEVESHLVRKFAINRRTARKWIARVKAQWREAAEGTHVEESRGDLIEQLNAVIAAAWNHTAIVKDKDGNPILDQNPASPRFGQPLLKADPKTQNVLHAVSQLRALLGADRPVKAHVTLDGDLNVMPDVGTLPDAVADKLRKELEAIAPGGDIRQLAGEWFRQTGEPESKG